MKAFFINEDSVKYAEAIVQGRKTYETRSRNMLAPLVGERVAVVSTSRKRKPLVVGFVDVVDSEYHGRKWLDAHRGETLIPEGSEYDTPGRRCYLLRNPHACTPFPLPKDTVRHGRSWCEFSTTRKYYVEFVTDPGSDEVRWTVMEAQMPEECVCVVERAGYRFIRALEI